MKYIDGITIPWQYRTDVGPMNWSSNVTLIVTGLGLLALIIGVVLKAHTAQWNHNESQESGASTTIDEGSIFGAFISLLLIIGGTAAFAWGGSVWICHQCKSAAASWTAWATWVNPYADAGCAALLVVVALAIPADWNAGIRNNLVTAGVIRDGQSHIRRVWMFDIGGYVWLSDVHANEPQISVALDQPVVLDQQEKGDG